MKRQAQNLTHHRGIGGATTNCRRRRADHKKSTEAPRRTGAQI